MFRVQEVRVVTVTYVQSDGERTVIEAHAGDSVMTAATENAVRGIIGDCGGGMTCATCHVFVEPDWLEVAGPRAWGEDGTLESAAVQTDRTSRLGCQIVLDEALDGLVVRVPERQE
jgi:ferredoxin, 2Fe-2S